MTYLCRVCSIKWDFIGKVESVFDDSEYIMDKAGVKGLINLGLHPKETDHTRMITYFKGMEKSIVLELYKIYQPDFELFGYYIPEWLWEHLIDE